jgi:hypothetical protein
MPNRAKVNLLPCPRSLKILGGTFTLHFTPCRLRLSYVILPP